MGSASPGLRWGVERRLEFIEFRLYWEGGINRSDITGFFGVSVPQASKDLSQYQEIAPGNMDYDKSEKRYFATNRFRPKFLQPEADQFLSQLRAVTEQESSPDETWLGDIPMADWMPIPHRRVDPAVLRTLLTGIRNGQAVEVFYQSMSEKHPDPIWRVISPHALGSDGFRWHVRAFCSIDRIFKDFLLSRCLKCKPAGEAEAKTEDDRNWHEMIELKLKPNPGLSKAQQEIIASDFNMNNNHLSLLVRKSLLYYFHKRLRLDVAEALDDPREAPVVIANKAEFKKALEEANA